MVTNYGEGAGYKTGEGGGGCFEVGLIQELEVLAILMGGGGAQIVSTL